MKTHSSDGFVVGMEGTVVWTQNGKLDSRLERWIPFVAARLELYSPSSLDDGQTRKPKETARDIFCLTAVVVLILWALG